MKILNLINESPSSRIRIIILIFSILCSSICYIAKEYIFENYKVNIHNIRGQINNHGTHNLGDYTIAVDNLIKEGSLEKNGKVLNRYPPGYPLILYGVYSVSSTFNISFSFCLFILAALCIAFSTLLIGEIAYLLYKRKSLALLAGLLFTTHPYVLQGITKAMSVTPFMLFFYLSILICSVTIIQHNKNPFRFVIIGVSFGLAILIRPIGIFLPVIASIVILIFYRKSKIIERIVFGVLIIISALMTIIPWQYYNASHNQKIFVSSSLPFAVWDGVSFYNRAYKEDISLPKDIELLSKELSKERFETINDVKEKFTEALNKNPYSMGRLFLLKAARAWYGVYDQNISKERVKMFITAFYGLFVLLALFKIKFNNNSWKIFGVSSLLYILYFWGITTAVLSIVRYMYPIIGLSMIFIPAIFNKVKLPFFEKIRNRFNPAQN